jgi:cytochrome c oxidase subunit 2
MLLLFAQIRDKTFWLPKQCSTVSDSVDELFYLIFWITTVFTVGIVMAMIWFAIKYRARKGAEHTGESAGHSTALELTWTIIPTIIVLVIFFRGFRTFLDMAVEPPNAYEVQVSARKWAWSFTYPNGFVSDELHVPKGTPVRLIQSSEDVIHSLFVPQFRIKRDVVPGRYNRQWFNATQSGTFDIYCAEYCGKGHSRMLTKVIVHETQADFQAWLEKGDMDVPPVELGKLLYEKRGCVQCHSLDGSAKSGGGPSWKDLYGTNRTLADGRTRLADENYISDSILDPAKDIAVGGTGTMPSFRGQLKPHQINALIAFMKTLSSHGGSATPATQPQKQPGAQ